MLAVLTVLVLANGARAHDENIRNLAKAKLEIARKLYQKLLDQEKKHVLDALPLVYEASRRLLDAELEVASNKAAKVLAYKAHLDRMKTVEQKMKKIVATQAAPPGYTWVAEYNRLEAEIWLAKAKQK